MSLRILILSAKRQRDVAARSIAAALSPTHEVVEFDYASAHMPLFGIVPLRRFSHAYRRVLELGGLGETAVADAALRHFVAGRRFDVVIVQRVNVLPPDVVEALRGTGALVLGWFMDALVNFGAARFFEAPYHRVFFKDRVVVAHLREITRSPAYEYLAQGFDPALHRPLSGVTKTLDVGTYGSGYPHRAALLAPLLARIDRHVEVRGQPARITSPELRRAYRPYVRGEEKRAAVARYRIALNAAHFSELGGVNKRTFELAGMGAFQLTDGVAVHHYFEPEVEVATFRGGRDLVEKVDFYLANPALRERIAAAGLRRAWRSHTWAHRCNELFERVPELRGVPRVPVPEQAPPHEDELSGAAVRR